MTSDAHHVETRRVSVERFADTTQNSRFCPEYSIGLALIMKWMRKFTGCGEDMDDFQYQVGSSSDSIEI